MTGVSECSQQRGNLKDDGYIDIKGENGPIDKEMEVDANWTVKFNEMSCDSQGNILIKSYWFSPASNDSWLIKDKMRLMILCSKEPTHRLIIETGEIIDNKFDNDYLRNMIFSYTILRR
ncbi:MULTISPECIES: hypothetical protein [Photorhabdus]|uniref:Uncharacterized protein n=1 Tax=Photorhabdus bodei TaxID=2029681 RepID=A0AAW6BFK8_9GAMM|nr:hypothetical protein [Photorhabdus bodei]MCC8466800.1 hypothetical protein [Photorhabdus bodei]MDB6372329.1 hypothetical protein [Photorhabdus bodei]